MTDMMWCDVPNNTPNESMFMLHYIHYMSTWNVTCFMTNIMGYDMSHDTQTGTDMFNVSET